MQHSERFLLPTSLALAPFLAACTQTLGVTSADVADVLTKAAFAASKKLPASFCIDPKLERSPVIWRDKPGPDGWIVPSNTHNLHYRRVSSPIRGKLPDAALAAFSNAKGIRDCHHTLVFDKPDFIQFRSPTETYIEAIISFYDRCSLCGRGYTVRLRQIKNSWAMEPPGIEATWIS